MERPGSLSAASGEASGRNSQKTFCKDPFLKNSGLKKCFSAIVDRKQVNLELDVLTLMLQKELQIPLSMLEPDLVTILPYLLVHYIKIWPEWKSSSEYYSGKISFKSWYEKFHKYVTSKLKEAIDTTYLNAVKEIRDEKTRQYQKSLESKEVVEGNSQTDHLAPKILAPFTISITAKPVLLNTIVFSDLNEADIILKTHTGLEWDENIMNTITVKEIITWPYVTVRLLSPVLAFSRKNLHEVSRYISVIGLPLPIVQQQHIESVNIINPIEERECFAFRYIKIMCQKFLEALGFVYTKPAVVETYKAIIDEFLLDLAEINILRGDKITMASNTSVVFNIGSQNYFRNKKLSKGSSSRNDVTYTEMIIPKMETSLISLAPIAQFEEYLEKLKQLASSKDMDSVKSSLPQITFSCTYCVEDFRNIKLLAEHFKDVHKMENAILCTRCKKSFSALSLAKSRWTHTCHKT